MAVYKYRPIDLDGPAIRLLRLAKGDFTDDIQCDLFEGWINQSDGGMPYDALSYTWGTTEMAAKITVNGSTMHITSNLHIALRHLRLANEDRILWVDAICINQDNKEERRHQVQHMSYIYKEAEQVVIWLGEGTEETDFIMDSIKRLQENYCKVEGDWRRSAQLWMRLPGPGNISRDYNVMWRKGMELILMRPWFRRIWILQEIANARVATILCGNKSVSARTFAQVPSIIGLTPEPHCQAVLDIMPGFSRKESWWGQNRSLFTLLVKFRESQATDERDIIYALLGISSDAFQSDILLPDYEKSLQQVIQDTTSFLLGQDNSLFKFLNWTLLEFLQSLDSLSSAVLGSASENGQEAMAKLLLATDGVDADLKNNDGWTPLQRAMQNRHKAIVKLLLEEGVELESKDKEGRTPLLWAAQNGYEALVRLLLEKGAELDSKDKEGRTPLLCAAWNGYEAVVRLLLEKGAELESKDKEGRMSLLWAARNGHKAVVRLLLEMGVEADSKDSLGQTPLSWAASMGHEAVVRLLLEMGVEADSKDTSGQTPLAWAASMGHEVVVRLLLEEGVEADSKNITDQTPLAWAAIMDHEAVVRLLLEGGVEADSKDTSGRTPLAWAASRGHEAVVRLLLEMGVEADSKDTSGRTPLAWAASMGHEAVVRLLLEMGVEADSRDTSGRTPLSWAASMGHEAVTQPLISHSDGSK